MEIFPKIYGAALPDAIDTLEAEDFRTLGTSFFMVELLAILRKDYPRIVYSANGGPHLRHDPKTRPDWGRRGPSGGLHHYASHGYSPSRAYCPKRPRMTIEALDP